MQLKNFHVNEFPPNTLNFMNLNLLYVLQDLRDEWKQEIYPSRHPDGWARFRGSKNNRHYAIDRLSDAGDIFPTGNVVQFWMMCLSNPKIGGIGIYFDTNRYKLQPGPMIHIDLRPERLLWSRIAGKYYYFSKKEEVYGHYLTLANMTNYVNSLIG